MLTIVKNLNYLMILFESIMYRSKDARDTLIQLVFSKVLLFVSVVTCVLSVYLHLFINQFLIKLQDVM